MGESIACSGEGTHFSPLFSQLLLMSPLHSHPYSQFMILLPISSRKLKEQEEDLLKVVTIAMHLPACTLPSPVPLYKLSAILGKADPQPPLVRKALLFILPGRLKRYSTHVPHSCAIRFSFSAISFPSNQLVIPPILKGKTCF